MKWVTRARPKTDRIACPWLIRRFIDPDAEIVYVARDQVLAAAAQIADGVNWRTAIGQPTFSTAEGGVLRAWGVVRSK